VAIGLVIVAAIVLAIAARCGGSEPSPRTSDRSTAGAAATTGSGSASDRTAAPAITRLAPAVGSGSARAADREAQYKLAIQELETGKTCEARRAAIGKLVELADHRAVDKLQRATSRKGPRDEGNGCLKAEAEAAIKTLSAHR
jgi:hypothetical protein